MPAQENDTTTDAQSVDVAGAPAASTRYSLSLRERCWRAFRAWRQRQRLRITLHNLTERELTDIGVTRAEIECITARRTINRLRDGTAGLWMR